MIISRTTGGNAMQIAHTNKHTAMTGPIRKQINQKWFVENKLTLFIHGQLHQFQIVLPKGPVKPWANQETLLRKHCDSPCFLKCFCVCPPVETSLQKHNLLPEKQKCFLSNSETFHVSQVRFLLRKHCFVVFAHLGKHGETLARNNVSQFAQGLTVISH